MHPEPPAPEPDPSPPAPPLLGPLTEAEALIAGDMDPNGPLRLVVSHPRRLQDGPWYHNDISLVLSEELAMWETITTGRVVHVRGPAIFDIIQGPERSDRFHRRMQSHLKECHLMVFFCHTLAHWVLAVADTVSHIIQVFDPLPGRAAGISVERTLSSFIDSLVTIRATQDPVWSWSLGDCAEQTDCTSCDPRTILNLIRVVHHQANGAWSPGPDIRAIRRRVAAMLLTPVAGAAWFLPPSL